MRAMAVGLLVVLGPACGWRTGLEVGDAGPRAEGPRPDGGGVGPGPGDGGARDGSWMPAEDAAVDAAVDGGHLPGEPTARVLHLSAGWRHTCAVDRASVWCWGFGASGQLGSGSGRDELAPRRVEGLPPVAEVSAGLQHTCALTTGREVWCWGNNSIGQLGDGTFEHRYRPVRVEGVVDAMDVAAGGEHTCVLLTTGTARCWGHNHDGRLGDGTTVTRNRPVAVIGVSDGVEIAAGRSSVHVLRSDGTILFLEGEARVLAHVPDTLQMAGGACVLREGGVVQCGSEVVVAGGARHVAEGDGGACAARAEGVLCWGGVRGSAWGAVPGTSDALQVAVGYEHACALLRRDVVCWGRDDFGQLGNGPDRAHGTVRVGPFGAP